MPEPAGRWFVDHLKQILRPGMVSRAMARLSHGHQVVVSDLYAMRWAPALGPADFGDRADPDYLDPSREQMQAARRIASARPGSPRKLFPACRTGALPT